MNKLITIDYIKTFNPCTSGLNNLIKHYPECNMKLSKFLTLEHIPYDDKTWLANKVVDYKILQQWAVECAEYVLETYNKEYPNDNRVSNCIETTKKYLLGESTLEELEAARSAGYLAYSAAYAATSAAYSTVNAARSAYSAAYSVTAAEYLAANAANSAAFSARSAAYAARSAAYSAEKDVQETINLSILIALLENV